MPSAFEGTADMAGPAAGSTPVVNDPHRTSDVQCTGCQVAVRATLPWSVYVGAPDPDTTVPILPITFEPFDRLRRQMVGEPFPGD